MSKHIDINDISRYVSNKMSPEEETSVQEHISGCEECSKKLKDFRTLHSVFMGEEKENSFKNFFFKVYHNPIVRVAAVIAIVAGVGFAIYSSRPKGTKINVGTEAPTYLSTDSLSRDSIPDQDTMIYVPQENK